MADFSTNPVLAGFPADYTNPRGIPRAIFVENVEQHVSKEGPVETILKQFQELHSKYKFMELQLVQKKNSLKPKIPQIMKTLQMVNYLKSKQDDDVPLNTHFELSDNIYANGIIKNPSSIVLWLGADVLAEFPLDEALDLLQKNLDNSVAQLKSTDEDLAWIKEQTTTMEVNIARIYNYDVLMKRQAGTAASGSSSAPIPASH